MLIKRARHECINLALLLLCVASANACSFGTEECGEEGGCTPPLGYCIAGKCYDRKAKEVDCDPNYEPCNGVACSLDEFCFAGRVCLANTCKIRRQYECPADTSPLRSVACNSPKYTDCYRSEAFNCSIGAGTAEVNCSLQQTSAATATVAFLRTFMVLTALLVALLGALLG